MKKRKRRCSILAIILALMLSISLTGVTSFADLPAEAAAEELVEEEDALEAVPEYAGIEEEASEIAEEAMIGISEEETAGIAEEDIEKEQEAYAAPAGEASSEEAEAAAPEAAVEEEETVPETEIVVEEEKTVPETEIVVEEEETVPETEIVTEEKEAAVPETEAAAPEEETAAPEVVKEEAEAAEETGTSEADAEETGAVEQAELIENETISEEKLQARQLKMALNVYCTHTFDYLRYNYMDLGSNYKFSTNDSYYTISSYKWQKKLYYGSSWSDVPNNYQIKDDEVYRLYVVMQHSFASTGNTSADQQNQLYDFGMNTILTLYKASNSSSGQVTPYGDPFEMEVLNVELTGTQNGTSTLYAASEYILPRFQYSVTRNPDDGGTVVVGDGNGSFQIDLLNETGIYTGGDDDYLYFKITPASGYMFYSFVDAYGTEWYEDELYKVSSGSTLTLGIYIGDDPPCCCGTLKFNFVKKPTSISLPSSLSLKRYGEAKLNAVITPSDCTLPVTWSSTDSSVASVDKNGVVTGNKVGTAIIKATVAFGSVSVTNSCTVYVSSPSIHINYFANTSKGVLLGWDAVPGATEYVVARMIYGDESTAESVGAGITTNSFLAPLDGLVSGALYEYEVYALKDGVPICDTSDCWYYVGTTTMNAPTCTAKGLRVTWPKVDWAQKYVVFRHIGTGTPSWKYVTTVTATSAAAQEYRTTSTAGLVPGQWYAYTVRAIGEMDTYGGQPAGRSVRYREPVKTTKLQSISTGVRATFTSVAAGFTYGLYRAPVTGETVGSYSLVSTVTNSSVGKDVWITDTSAVSGKKYSYYVRCLSKDKKVPLSSFANTMQITYKKP